MDSWINYAIVIFITTVIVSIITENSVISRIQCSEGVQYQAGKCRLKEGYSKVSEKLKDSEEPLKNSNDAWKKI